MRFSVIIPLYNKAPYIEKALRSVLAQTFTDYELVVVDDGSQDDSANVAEKVLEEFSIRHKLIHQDNAGVSCARNRGVAESRGEFLCFLDADDWWDPTFLERMAGLITEYPEAGIYGTGYTIVNESRHKTRVAPIGIDPGFEKGYIDYFQVYAKTLAMPLTSISVAIPRNIFVEMQGFPKGIKLGEDFLLWAHIALQHKVAFLNQPLAYYNQDSNVQWRATGHLHEPSSHMLWNLGDLGEVEKCNADFKLLIDNIRTYSLFPYYLSKRYRDIAKKELDKVDWEKQTSRTRSLYRLPISFLRFRQWFRGIGSNFKRLIFRYL